MSLFGVFTLHVTRTKLNDHRADLKRGSTLGISKGDWWEGEGFLVSEIVAKLC